MKQKLIKFWEENQKPIVQVGGALVGGLLGLGLTLLILSATDEELIELDDLEVE